jgi:predicted acetyltransferase
MEVIELNAGTDEAFAGLWRHLLGIDLVDTIEARRRPVDEPVALLLTEPRAVHVVRDDDVWLRLVDVFGALTAREYEGEPVVLDVADPVLEANSGRYRVSADGVNRTDLPAQLRLGVDVLAMLYFGAWQASALAATGRIQVVEPTALERVDRLFAGRRPAWCGTFF